MNSIKLKQNMNKITYNTQKPAYCQWAFHEFQKIEI